MVEITRRVDSQIGPVEPRCRLRLSFELRSKSRLRTQLENGEDAWLMLARGEILRGGDLLLATDGRVIEVIPEPERLLHVECEDAQALARAAYHLGNRHVPVEVGDGYLRLAFDHVLQHMLQGLRARIRLIDSPFEPEAGAYAGHAHLEDGARPGRIHEYGKVREAL